MSLGSVTAQIVTGGGGAPASGADLARTIVQLGTCTAGTPGTLYHSSSKPGQRSALGAGQLIESQALIYDVAGAPAPYAVPVEPSVAGGFSSVTHTGSASSTTITPAAAPVQALRVRCTNSGALETAKFRFSLDGGTTYGAEVTSGASPWTYRVPGTFTKVTLTDAVDPFVSGETYTFGADGSTTHSSGWKGTASQASSPLLDADVVVTVLTGGALGAATVAVSLDGGRTQYGPALFVPSGGVTVVPGVGIYLTSSAALTAGDAYAFAMASAQGSSQNLSDALAAFLVAPDAPAAAVIHDVTQHASVSAAVSAAQAMQTFLASAFAAGKDYQGIIECPLAGDIINASGTVSIDTADDRATVKAALAAIDVPRVSVFVGTDNVQSSIGTYQTRRPRGSVMAARIAGKLPVEADRSTVATRDASLDVAKIGNDERLAAISLDDVRANTFQTVQGLPGVFLSITRGGYGWKNLTADAEMVDADSLRMINAVLAGFRPTAAKIIGRRYPINADGTIEAKTRGGLDTMLDAAIKKAAGIGVGAQFGGIPQCSSATAAVDPSSNLGATGDKVVYVDAAILPQGFASAVHIRLAFQGA